MLLVQETGDLTNKDTSVVFLARNQPKPNHSSFVSIFYWFVIGFTFSRVCHWSVSCLPAFVTGVIFSQYFHWFHVFPHYSRARHFLHGLLHHLPPTLITVHRIEETCTESNTF